MSPRDREKFLIAANEALSDPLRTMGEGRPHKKAKTRALDMLGLHFKAKGRVIYLAEEMSVVYPREAVFTPDLLAVVGVEEPEDDQRLAWVVADEQRGLDFVLEVLHHGDRAKDLVDNVQRYARLGIPEYFVYDHAQQKIHGYRLAAGEKRYQRIVPQRGRYASSVLGLDLALDEGRLRFFDGMAELFGTADLLARLTRMMESLEAKAEEAAKRIEQSDAKADRASILAARGVLAVLTARRLDISEAAREQLLGERDPDRLDRWMNKAISARSIEEVFSDAD